MESRVHLSLHPNCHHQITYAKFNLKIHYPPPYEREIWYYDQANVDHIRKAVDLFPWKKIFKNPNINDMIFLFNKTVKNIISNYIPLKQLHLMTGIFRGLAKIRNSSF